MGTYRITVNGLNQKDVKATYPAVALKRYLDGGAALGYTIATVGVGRMKMSKGTTALIQITRFD